MEDVVARLVGIRDPLVAELVPQCHRALADAGLRLDEEPAPRAWVLVHDTRCPFTPADELRRVLAEARRAGAARVGVRPVTDTVKVVRDGVLGETVDRDTLVQVASPLVVPPGVALPVGDDLATLVGALRRHDEVGYVEVDARCGRVADASDLALLRALS